MELCVIAGCGRPTQRSTGQGLSRNHCRYHVQFRNRHGSFSKGTYRAAYLKPYRQAVETHLRALGPTARANALNALHILLLSGRYERVIDVKRLPPVAKARAAIARLRDNGVPPLRILTAYLTVAAAVKDDPIRPGGDPEEYRRVQIAKAVHRLASGQHSDYGEWGSFHRYPRSSGLALRHLGRLLDEACSSFAERELDAIIARKVAADKARCEAVTAEIAAERFLWETA